MWTKTTLDRMSELKILVIFEQNPTFLVEKYSGARKHDSVADDTHYWSSCVGTENREQWTLIIALLERDQELLHQPFKDLFIWLCMFLARNLRSVYMRVCVVVEHKMSLNERTRKQVFDYLYVAATSIHSQSFSYCIAWCT